MMRNYLPESEEKRHLLACKAKFQKQNKVLRESSLWGSENDKEKEQQAHLTEAHSSAFVTNCDVVDTANWTKRR